jgi:hypothetical protein
MDSLLASARNEVVGIDPLAMVAKALAHEMERLEPVARQAGVMSLGDFVSISKATVDELTMEDPPDGLEDLRIGNTSNVWLPTPTAGGALYVLVSCHSQPQDLPVGVTLALVQFLSRGSRTAPRWTFTMLLHERHERQRSPVSEAGGHPPAAWPRKADSDRLKAHRIVATHGGRLEGHVLGVKAACLHL